VNHKETGEKTKSQHTNRIEKFQNSGWAIAYQYQLDKDKAVPPLIIIVNMMN
jgi:hypothetical protein